ncbi:hypothetical protein BG261_01690 [Floricoccus tropicus]|uniref:N-acetyltransferase domain-containing protein n=1 Tax=Floricoccus tropicus TaxID=1859473 RepID=A0A1E8GM59_9LACT|nr:GNAT family N-acetyltransferase [Floricoccus tropicus]OFI49320.1 hypothetical protein BG261_01690 [Floricoccus tropicus]
MTVKIIKNKQIEADKLFQLMSTLDKETNYMLYQPEERKYDRKKLETFIQNTSENGLILVAEEDSEYNGYIFAQVTPLTKIKHSAYLVIGVLSDHAGQGLGSELLAQVIDWARVSGIHRLELTVVTENSAAIGLYKKFGFIQEGVKKDSLLVNGRYYDEFYMARILD